MYGVTQDVFPLAAKSDHTDDPALAVDGLSDFLPVQVGLGVDSALAVGTLDALFPGGEAGEIDVCTADHALMWASEAPEETPLELPAETPHDDKLCVLPLFESGLIVQSDIQRAALEFQRFAEQFHAFACQCLQRGTV